MYEEQYTSLEDVRRELQEAVRFLHYISDDDNGTSTRILPEVLKAVIRNAHLEVYRLQQMEEQWLNNGQD
jgi:hypothetical protein